jgi:hypothetical protein
VSFAAITLCIASQRVFIVVSVYFVTNSVRKFLDILSYIIIYLPRWAPKYLTGNVKSMNGPGKNSRGHEDQNMTAFIVFPIGDQAPR